MKNVVIVFLSLFAMTIPLNAQVLDENFGVSGKVTTNINQNANFHRINAILQVPNQKILVGGSDNTNAYVLRYNQDGTLDTSFQDEGHILLPFTTIVAFAKKSDNELFFAGSIVAFGGNTDFIVGKIDSDGNLDSTFGTNGIKQLGFGYQSDDNASGIALQSDGKIIVVGNTTFGPNSLTQHVVIRLLPNGEYDTSFNTDGIFTLEMVTHRQSLRTVDLMDDGKIVCSGSVTLTTGSNQGRMCVLRLLPNGSLDTTFATVGYRYFNPGTQGGSTVNSHITFNDGSVLLGGSSYTPNNSGVINNFTLVKLDAFGAIDTTFANNGVAVNFFLGRSGAINKLVLDDNQNIYAVGASAIVGVSGEDFAISKCNANGELITDFGSNGYFFTDFAGSGDFPFSFFIENNKILVAGTATVSTNPTKQFFAMARIIDESLLNTINFSADEEYVVYPTIFSDAITITASSETMVGISLFDYAGRKLIMSSLVLQQNGTPLNLSTLAKGNYILKIKSVDNIEKTVKIVKR